MNDDIRKMLESKIRDLTAKNVELEKENSQLKHKDMTPNTRPVLDFIAHSSNPPTTSEVASGLKIEPVRARYLLDILTDGGWVAKPITAPEIWVITKKGRAAVFES